MKRNELMDVITTIKVECQCQVEPPLEGKKSNIVNDSGCNIGEIDAVGNVTLFYNPHKSSVPFSEKDLMPNGQPGPRWNEFRDKIKSLCANAQKRENYRKCLFDNLSIESKDTSCGLKVSLRQDADNMWFIRAEVNYVLPYDEFDGKRQIDIYTDWNSGSVDRQKIADLVKSVEQAADEFLKKRCQRH